MCTSNVRDHAMITRVAELEAELEQRAIAGTVSLDAARLAGVLPESRIAEIVTLLQDCADGTMGLVAYAKQTAALLPKPTGPEDTSQIDAHRAR